MSRTVRQLSAGPRTGLNQNLLTPRAHFLAVVSKGWAFLSSTALQADGLVGYCQPGGGSPVSATTCTHALLLTHTDGHGRLQATFVAGLR